MLHSTVDVVNLATKAAVTLRETVIDGEILPSRDYLRILESDIFNKIDSVQ